MYRRGSWTMVLGYARIEWGYRCQWRRPSPGRSGSCVMRMLRSVTGWLRDVWRQFGTRRLSAMEGWSGMVMPSGCSVALTSRPYGSRARSHQRVERLSHANSRKTANLSADLNPNCPYQVAGS